MSFLYQVSPVRVWSAFSTDPVGFIENSVLHLQKVPGHLTLEMTRRYANLVTADLQAMDERVRLLSR